MAVSDVASMFKPLQSERRGCDEHGEYTAKLFRVPGADEPRWTSCPLCMLIRVQAEDAENIRQIVADRRRRQVEDQLGRAAIPERFLDRSLDSYQADTAKQVSTLAKCREYADTFEERLAAGTCLIMCGNPGTGKTHLAVGIAREIMKRGHMAMYALVRDVDRMIKETWRKDSPRTERDLLGQLATPELLILDEVGHQRGTADERMHLFDVINARYERRRPTILISNLGLPELRGDDGNEGYLDPRAVDRLREGGGRVLIFDWSSARGAV